MNRWKKLHITLIDYFQSKPIPAVDSVFEELLIELELLLIESEHLFRSRDKDTASRCLDFLIAECTSKTASSREIRAFYRTARWAERLGLQEMAMTVFERLLVLTDDLRDPGMHVQALEEIGEIYRKKGEFERASEYQLRAKGFAGEMNLPELEAHALNNLGVIAIEQGDLELAESWFNRSIEKLESAPEPLLEGHVYNNLGVIHCIKGHPELGCIEFNRALFFRDQARDRNGFAETIHNLGMTAIEMNRLDDAEDYLDQALVIARELGRRNSVGNIQLARSELFLKRRETVIGARLAGEALRLLKDLNDVLGIADALRLTAEAEFQKGDLEAARKVLSEAIELNRQHHHILGLAQCRETLFKIELLALNPDEAEFNRNQAVELWEQLGNVAAAKRLRNPDQIL